MIVRAWRLPLGAHLVALLVVVGGLLALTGPGVAFFSDEGAVLVQSKLLVEDATWYYEGTEVVADPEDAARPFENGDLGTEGLAPYAKHPLYPVIVASVTRADAIGALVLSVSGAVVAAGLAGLITRRIDDDASDLCRLCVWVVGLASPLLFAAGLVVAHTLAAALAAASVAAALWVVAADGGRRWHLPAGLTVIAVSTALAAMLRTEAVFLGPALGVAALVSIPKLARRRAAAVAAVAVLGSITAVLLDRVWSRSIVGTAIGAPTDNTPPRTGSWPLDRLHGLYTTTVQAGYALSRSQELITWIAVILLVGGVVLWRLRIVSDRAALLVSTVGIVTYAFRVFGSSESVPGVLVAFPLLAVAVVLQDRSVVVRPSARLPLVSAVLCAGAIVLTQYPDGGGLEWGWRYSAFLLPVAIPPLLWGANQTVTARGVAPAIRAPAIILVLLAAVLPSALALRAMAASHHADRQVASAIAAVAPDAAGPDGTTIVLSWNRLLPQILHHVFDDYDWVVPARDDLPTYSRRLADAGVDRVVLVGPDTSGVEEELAGQGWRATVRGPDAPYDVVVLVR